MEIKDKQDNTKAEQSISTTGRNQQKRTPKQIAALLCVILLICLYLFTFVIACLDFPGAHKLFPICLMATIGLPILLWLYIWLYGMMKEKHTMASTDLLHSDSRTGTRLPLSETASFVSEKKESESDNNIE